MRKFQNLLFRFRFPGEIRARYLEYGHSGGLLRRKFELVRRSVSRILRRTSSLRGASSLPFHQEREPAAFFGNILNDFGFTLPDDACVKAPALAINVFVNLDAVLDAHAKRDIRILANAIQFLADMCAVEIQFQNTVCQAVPERKRDHVGHARIGIVKHRDMAGRALFYNFRDIFIA